MSLTTEVVEQGTQVMVTDCHNTELLVPKPTKPEDIGYDGPEALSLPH